jgi:hypothetical protein
VVGKHAAPIGGKQWLRSARLPRQKGKAERLAIAVRELISLSGGIPLAQTAYDAVSAE